MIRIGIVGTGAMAAARACIFGKVESLEVAGICSRSLAKAQALGVRPFDDFHKLLSESDAVVICVPNYAHASLASEALKAGKHVLVEYPLAVSLDEAEALRLAAAESGRVLMVGNTIIHEAMYRYLQQSQRRLGRILSAASRVTLYSQAIADSWYMSREKTGPVFAAFHYHHIEYYRRLLGEVEWAVGRPLDETDRRTVGGPLLMGHRGGATSCIQWYVSAKGNGLPRSMWINGSESSVTILSQEAGRSQVIWDGGGEGKVESYEDDWGVAGSCADFIEAIEGRLDHAARLDSDIETLRVGLTVREAWNG